MADKVKIHDFVELDYTGKLADGTIFDTTSAAVAKNNNLFSEKTKYGSLIICVGEKQVLPGLDEELVEKELDKEYTMTLPPEKAFGKRDIKRLKVIPFNTFREHKLDPHPGLQIDVDGEMGTVTSVSGGRVIVNFNHPLAGKEVIYTVKMNRFVTDHQEQIKAFLNATLRIPESQVKIEIKEEKARVELPLLLPPPLADALKKKLVEVTGLKDMAFSVAEKEKE